MRIRCTSTKLSRLTLRRAFLVAWKERGLVAAADWGVSSSNRGRHIFARRALDVIVDKPVFPLPEKKSCSAATESPSFECVAAHVGHTAFDLTLGMDCELHCQSEPKRNSELCVPPTRSIVTRKKSATSPFLENDFFDPSDLLQLKDETIRAVEVEGHPVDRTAVDFASSEV
jgi:hypothetical protein